MTINRWLAPLALLAASAVPTRAELVEYYLGRDLRQTIPTGTYAGLPNPNVNRVTFLYAHTFPADPANNHYHAKSVYSYVGPNLGANTAVQPFPASNFLPEGATTPPLLLGLTQTGPFAGSMISGLTPGVPFANLRMKSVDSLATFAPNTPEGILFNSGGTSPPGRWTGSMAGSVLSLEVISLTAGLAIANPAGTTILTAPGDRMLLGQGGTLDITPVFVASTMGNHSARFRIVDTGTGNNGGPWGASGEVVFNLRAVPEPSGVVLSGLGLAGLAVAGWAVRRRQTAPVA